LGFFNIHKQPHSQKLEVVEPKPANHISSESSNLDGCSSGFIGGGVGSTLGHLLPLFLQGDDRVGARDTPTPSAVIFEAGCSPMIAYFCVSTC
jgi:hypothetical protein